MSGKQNENVSFYLVSYVGSKQYQYPSSQNGHQTLEGFKYLHTKDCGENASYANKGT